MHKHFQIKDIPIRSLAGIFSIVVLASVLSTWSLAFSRSERNFENRNERDTSSREESEALRQETAAASAEARARILTPPTTPDDGTGTPGPSPTDGPLLFGVGTELDSAINHRITKESPVKLLTSWYNGPNDLGFMNGWRNTLVPQAYAKGYALHLVIYNDDPEKSVNTKYGPACGRPYPVSEQFLSDMQQLAQNFAGGKLYVSMFTEFQTYPCDDNVWVTGENYYKALKDNYLAAMDIFHQTAPGSQVSLSWGGWQTNWDDPGRGGGRSLIARFADVLNASDFQSFQSMANHDNLPIITEMTKALSPYPGGVMVSHYKPDHASQTLFESDINQIFTPENIASLKQHGLFAFSFMDEVNMNGNESAFQAVKNVISTYAR